MPRNKKKGRLIRGAPKEGLRSSATNVDPMDFANLHIDAKSDKDSARLSTLKTKSQQPKLSSTGLVQMVQQPKPQNPSLSPKAHDDKRNTSPHRARTPRRSNSMKLKKGFQVADFSAAASSRSPMKATLGQITVDAIKEEAIQEKDSESSQK